MQGLRRIPLGGALNVRDLGGYPRVDGGATPYGRFYRSDSMSCLTGEEVQKLWDAGIRTVVDLRTPGEIHSLPNSFEEVEGVSVAYCSLLGESTSNFVAGGQDGFLRSLGESYSAMLENGKPAFGELFHALAKGARDGGVLFHCTAGKDRTGVTAALLLELAGVYAVDIIADYTLTQVYLKEKVLRFVAENPAVPVEIFSAKDTSMEEFLQALNTQHGGARSYLRSVGITDAELDALWA